METAKIVTTLMQVLALFLLCLRVATRWHWHPSRHCDPGKCEGPNVPHGYTRFADVERRCESVLASAAPLSSVDGSLMYQLSFTDGDWSQDAGDAPLLPFHGSYADPAAAAGGSESLEAVPLASFRLRHMDMDRRPWPRTAVNASGVLSFTIARNRSCSYDPYFEVKMCPSPEFDLRPGIAGLQVLFQGVYTETAPSPGSGGERVLCMVGDALLPVRSRSSNSSDPWDWAKHRGGGSSSSFEPPPVVSDGNILLVLRYPKTPTLTTRAVHGVMTSTNAESDGAFFDTVRLVSQLSDGGYGYGGGSSYQFRQGDAELDDALRSEEEGHPPPPFHEGDAIAMEHHRRLNRGAASPCDMIYESIPNNQVMEIIPNWDCNGTDEFCSRPGPFVSGRSRPATATAASTSATEEDKAAFTRSAAIAVNGLQCKPIGGGTGIAAAARVAAVFRYVPPWEHQTMAAKRTGLSGTTLSAEGVWIPSTGRAHMVACLGVGKEACHYRVTISVQTTASMARRGLVAGQITSAMDDGRSHPPLLFQQRLYGRLGPYVPRMSYVYTKVEQARELLRASKPTGFRDSFVGKSLLSYPSVDAGGGGGNGDVTDDIIGSLSNLADELDLRYESMGKPPPPVVPEWIDGSSSTFFELHILSASTLVGRSYSRPQLRRGSSMQIVVELLKRVHQHVHGAEERQHQILNVSAEFMAYGNCRGTSPVMSLEGVYNAEDGRMHLIGCRTVHAPWRLRRRRLVSMSRDLEDGMDCSIEVVVEYPPTTTLWLIRRPAKVFIVSTRDDDDPLHFNRTQLDMLPVKYRQRRWRLDLDELMKLTVEGFLYIIVLLATIWAATRTSP